MMTVLLSFHAGVLASKLWRVAWRVRRGAAPVRALEAEFAPREEAPVNPRKRVKSFTEVA